MGKRLVLWDIDRTLLDVDGLGGEVFAAAFTEFSGIEMARETRTPGRTEWRWFDDMCVANGIEHAEDGFARFLQLQYRHFDERVEEMLRRGRVLPGVEEALRRCADDDDVVSSLLTGNTRTNAERKLVAFGLDHFVEVPLGGYGDDHIDRPELVAVARRRVQDHTGLQFTADTTVLVGDTPNDIHAARVGGARAVAVATGITDAESLRAAGADVVLPDLSDTDAVLEALRA